MDDKAMIKKLSQRFNDQRFLAHQRRAAVKKWRRKYGRAQMRVVRLESLLIRSRRIIASSFDLGMNQEEGAARLMMEISEALGETAIPV